MNQPHTHEYEILPSLFATSPLYFEKALQKIEASGYAAVHLDIMDGHFVPNISFGPALVADIQKTFPTLFREVHLMVSHPSHWIESFCQSGAQRIFFPIETESNVLQQSISLLQQMEIPWGFSINPETSIETLQRYETFLLQTDRLLVMSVHPGFSGQTYLSDTDAKIQQLHKQYPFLHLCIDGGIQWEHLPRLKAFGISSFVMGSAFFKNSK